MRKRLVFAFASFATTHLAFAASTAIAVNNYSFENPKIIVDPLAGSIKTATGTVSQASDTAIGGWGVQLFGGALDPLAGVQVSSSATDGSQLAYLANFAKGGRIYQDVGAIQPDTIYTLSVSVVYYTGQGGDGGIHLVNGTGSGPTDVLLPTTVPSLLPVHVSAQQAVVELSGSFLSGASAAGDLAIELYDAAGAVAFDNVRLTAESAAPVPEPDSWALMLSGLLALVMVGSRKLFS